MSKITKTNYEIITRTLAVEGMLWISNNQKPIKVKQEYNLNSRVCRNMAEALVIARGFKNLTKSKVVVTCSKVEETIETINLK